MAKLHRRQDGEHHCVPSLIPTCFDHISSDSSGVEPSHVQTLVQVTDRINAALDEANNSNPPQGKQLAIIVEQEGLFLVWAKSVDDEEADAL
jgi:hypothetical protein